MNPVSTNEKGGGGKRKRLQVFGTFRLTPEQLEWVDARARSRGVPASVIIREAVERLMKEGEVQHG